MLYHVIIASITRSMRLQHSLQYAHAVFTKFSFDCLDN